MYENLLAVRAGDLIRRAIEVSGITHAELARTSGVSRSLIREYILGLREPSFFQFQRLLAATGVEAWIGLSTDEDEAQDRVPTPVPAPARKRTKVEQGRELAAVLRLSDTIRRGKTGV